MRLVAPALYADQCALIPELLRGLPFKVFAASSSGKYFSARRGRILL